MSDKDNKDNNNKPQETPYIGVGIAIGLAFGEGMNATKSKKNGK